MQQMCSMKYHELEEAVWDIAKVEKKSLGSQRVSYFCDKSVTNPILKKASNSKVSINNNSKDTDSVMLYGSVMKCSRSVACLVCFRPGARDVV